MSAFRPFRLAQWLGAVLFLASSLAPAVAQPVNYRHGHNDETASTVAFSPDGKTITAFVSGRKYNQFSQLIPFESIFPWNTVEPMQSKEHPATIRPLAGNSTGFAPDGRNLAVVTAEGTVVLIDTATWLDRIALKGSGSKLLCAAYSPDSKILATGGLIAPGEKGGVLIVWDANRGKELAALQDIGAAIHSVAWSADGKMLATGFADGTIKLWDTSTMKERGVPKGQAILKEHEGPVDAVAFAPDGKTLLSGGQDKSVRLWNVESGKELANLVGHARSVTLVAFGADGKTPITGSVDGTAHVWDVAMEKEQAILKAPEFIVAVALSADGKKVAMGGKNGLYIWNVPIKMEEAKPPP